MSDDPDAAPIVVDPNPLPEQLAAAGRTLAVLIGGISAIVGFLSRHDLAGLIAFLRSDQFLPVAGAAVAAGSFLYGQWKTRRHKATLVDAASAAPNEKFVVKGVDDTPEGPPDAAATAATLKADSGVGTAPGDYRPGGQP